MLAPWWRVVLALSLGLAAELTDHVSGNTAWLAAAGMALALAAIAAAGLGVYRSGLKALLHGRLNILALMSVAVTGAFLIGHWAEAAMVMALFVAAEKLEDSAMARARSAVRDLMAGVPQTVRRQGADGQVELVAVQAVQPGDTLLIAPGERIALDGQVLHGHSAVDQAPITGESTPVDKQPGDALYAGSINSNGSLRMRVTDTAGHTMLDRIVQMVAQSQQEQAPIQRTVDRFAAIYTPIVMVLALLVALVLPMLGWGWMEALYRALALLVIACPCALVIATPVAIVSALGNAARHGVLFKGGQALEKAQAIRAVAFDKTGTLTEGRPRLEDWCLLAPPDRASASATTARWLLLGQAVAVHSRHPVASAIAAGLAAQGHADASLAAQLAAEEAPGSGMVADWQSRPLRLGSLHWLAQQSVGQPDGAALTRIAQWRAQGFSVTALAWGGRLVALFAVTDTLRGEARQAVASLQQMGLHTVMLSGDSPEAARHMAERIGIADAQGGLLPQDKLVAVTKLNQVHGATAMVGDGINDAPALAQASLGIAMGGPHATDLAAETADVVLMGGHLRALPAVFRLARQTHAIVWQNIVLALAGKAVFLLLAMAGMATMWMAVVADLGISLAVVANGMRLRSHAASQPLGAAEPGPQ
ncbi:cation-translocating P-type ATPase [Corticibacter populi]|uniref:P-type Zn(2+) transporter n=1 Tax=Corticibacter populi TaxID=1550736 RepID=A0A3M6R1Y7_9BURK|nr:cation-translocating P-type ATPase [Corticibacter populi]RMX08772.1 cation-translocating P-type ATPase [Corticibacter populi]